MAQKTIHRTSFALDHGTLRQVDEFAERNDLNRSQTIRRALKVLIASEGGERVSSRPVRPRAPRPQRDRNGSSGP